VHNPKRALALFGATLMSSGVRSASPRAPRSTSREAAGFRALQERAASPRPLSRGRSTAVGRRKVIRWLNDMLVWGLAQAGGEVDEDPAALLEFMLLRPGEGEKVPFSDLSAEQREEFFHSGEGGGGGGEGPLPPPPKPPPALTVKGVLQGCWARVSCPRKRRVVLKECARAQELLGGEAGFRPFLLDAEEMCQRLLDGRPCAPLGGGGEAALFSWEAGAEARGLLAQPLVEKRDPAAAGREGAASVIVEVTLLSAAARLLLGQVAAFYGIRAVEAAREEGEGEGGNTGGGQQQQHQQSTRRGGALRTLTLALRLPALPGPNAVAIRATREALWEAWAETAADAGLPLQASPGEDGQCTPCVPCLLVFSSTLGN
jgi:hypothetical protein